ncbi:MAG TPA: MBL fold metallo-hydrolase [Ramlibacter sp.]|nr:MBL fold metallo-hydrolase [Ramlibacter sp.]
MTDVAPLPRGVTVLERGWLSSNNVVFTTGVTSVVDTGYFTHSAQTLALVQRELAGNALQSIVNTHLHSDHCGGNAALQAAYPGSRLLIPPGQADAVARWDEAQLSYTETGQSCARFSFDGVLRPGASVLLGESHWEVHAAPGHDPHSVILFEPDERALISADALWENGFGVVFPELDGASAFDEVGATLDVIEALAPRLVVPGHGSPFAGREKVGAAIARARSRLARFVANPSRHASHAMKVLVKFKLLEWQRVEFEQLVRWAEGMPYMRRVHSRFFGDAPLRDWLDEMTAELTKSGALGREGSIVYNI